MEFGFLCFILASSLVLLSSLLGASVTDSNWDDVVVTTVGRPATLPCVDGAARGAVTVNWKMKSPGDSKWKLVLSAEEGEDERKEFSGEASKASMRLTDSNFQDTGNFSLVFLPERVDGGLYSCLIKRQERKVRERIILLAVLTVTIVPRPPVLQNSILRLIAEVIPDFAYARITWAAPGGRLMRSETMRNTGTVAKLPQFQRADSGAYICMVHPNGNSSSPFFAFNVDVAVDAAKVASFSNITHGPIIRTATLALSSFSLSCPTVKGDYVRLYWQPPDNTRHKDMKLAYLYDRWRDEVGKGGGQQQLELAGPPYKHQDGSFSFHLRPGVKDGGLYICEVFLNDNVFSQATRLSVLKVKAVVRSPSQLELVCLYSERSQVERAGWRHHNLSCGSGCDASSRPCLRPALRCSSHSPGLITTSLALPIGPDAAGNYTCTLQLTNRQTIWAMHTVTLPPEVSVSASVPSLLPSLSALLLLVPLVAAAVGVLLWRQGHISRRDIEQSLSHYSGEVENIYENPEDIRQQTSPQASIYMDLKPRGEDDVYKELDRYEQCQG